MTRSTTWHSWDGMMEPSRQVLVSIGAVDMLTLQSCRQEIYTIDELLEAFKMERMSKAWRGDEVLSFFTDTNYWRSTSGILTSSIAPTGPEWSGAFQVFHSCFLFLLPASFCQVAAIFDTDKFKWVNGHHVRKLTDEEVLCLLHFVMFSLYSVPKDLQNLQHNLEAIEMIGSQLKEHGVVKEALPSFASASDSPFCNFTRLNLAKKMLRIFVLFFLFPLIPQRLRFSSANQMICEVSGEFVAKASQLLDDLDSTTLCMLWLSVRFSWSFKVLAKSSRLRERISTLTEAVEAWTVAASSWLSVIPTAKNGVLRPGVRSWKQWCISTLRTSHFHNPTREGMFVWDGACHRSRKWWKQRWPNHTLKMVLLRRQHNYYWMHRLG